MNQHALTERQKRYAVANLIDRLADGLYETADPGARDRNHIWNQVANYVDIRVEPLLHGLVVEEGPDVE